jgi:hypothetical protein
MMDPETAQPAEPKKGGVMAACYRCFFESNSSSAATYLRFSNASFPLLAAAPPASRRRPPPPAATRRRPCPVLTHIRAQMLNALLLMFAGISSLTSLGNWVTLALSFIFLSFYLTCFGCLLCCFELRVGWIETRVRDSFGFLYSYSGRAVFLLFLAGFGFGLISQSASLGYAVGILTAINALFNMIIIYRHGKLFEDPSAEYGGTAESNAAAYLQQNPQLARQALSAGMTVARDNPELARQGMQAGNAYAREHPAEAAQMATGAYRSTHY